MWPDFEERTGWRLQSDREPMDASLLRRLCVFFRPHNARLALANPHLLPHVEEWGRCDEKWSAGDA